MGDEDPRVVSRLQQELPGYARESGLARTAEREIAQSARDILEAMPALTRDQLGFASKKATRFQIVDSYLKSLPEGRRQGVVRELVRLEADLYSAMREARYATAARKLLEGADNKAGISRCLGISTSVMDRIMRDHRSDVGLNKDDPILTTLAPEIA